MLASMREAKALHAPAPAAASDASAERVFHPGKLTGPHKSVCVKPHTPHHIVSNLRARSCAAPLSAFSLDQSCSALSPAAAVAEELWPEASQELRLRLGRVVLGWTLGVSCKSVASCELARVECSWSTVTVA